MSVFGEILFLSNMSGTIVFVAVMIFLTIFEALLHSIEEQCSKRGYKGLIKKLYREFMIMGFISFAILLGTESSSEGFNTSNQWYQSFHLAHIVILFIGITFLCQAFLLVSLISYRNKTLLSYGDSNPEKLALEYITIHTDGGWKRWFFDHGLITVPFPRVRERIEYKMLHEFFINFYSLPREFKFANYMSQALKNYIISLVEVRPITWIVLVAFIALNYLRIIWVDPVYQHDVCERYPAKTMNYGVHRLLAGGGESASAQFDDHHAYEVCNEYTLRYVFFCSMLILFYLLGVFIASEIYMQRLIDKVLDVEETIEKEEDRIAAEETPMYDADELHDRDSVNGEATTTSGGKSTHVRRQLSVGSAGGSVGMRRTGSNQSLDSIPSLPPYDLENGSATVNRSGGRTSIASTHRGSFSLPFFGGGEEDGHGASGGVTQALRGIVMGKSRRHLYLHCIQRMIQAEEEVTRKEARRMSIGSDDGGMHAAILASTRPQTLQSMPSRSRHVQLDQSDISDIYGQHFHHHYYAHNASSTDDSQANTTLTASNMAHVSSIVSSATTHHNHHLTFRENNPLSASSGPRRSHHQSASQQANSPMPPHRHSSHHHHHHHGGSVSGSVSGGSGRNFAYSRYFEIEKSPKQEDDGEEVDETDGEKFTGGCTMILLFVVRLLRDLVVWSVTFVVDVLLGNHMGHAHDKDQQDKDIKHRLQAFKSIFLWHKPGLYYFAVELSLLIQCFYIALWATNFVVIARDSYFPVLWEVALVVPLPINFLLLKQIIYTSCMLKSIVHIDQRTANRIIEQAVDERNVKHRLRRLVRDTMKTWDLPRKEWPARLQSYFDLFSDVDNTVDKENFKAFLHEIKIYLTDESLKNLFKVIDVDRDKRISWSKLSKLIFPDHKKQKKIKLRKRESESGRVAFEYVVSEEAKKEMEKENERRGSVLAMLSRVSTSTAEGAINVVRSNSITRMSMIAMLGQQPGNTTSNTSTSTSAPPAGTQTGSVGESKLNKLFPKIPSSSPSSPSSPGRKTLSLSTDATTATITVSTSTSAKQEHITTITTDPTTEQDERNKKDKRVEEEGEEEEEEEEEEEDFDSNDSTSGDESDLSDDDDEDDDEDENEYHFYDEDPAVPVAPAPAGTLSSPQPPSTAVAVPGNRPRGKGHAEEDLSVYNQPAASYEDINGHGVADSGYTYGQSGTVSNNANNNTNTSNNNNNNTGNVPVPGEVITLSSRISNLRISSRNLFDI